MHIISRKKLREFWAENHKAKLPLEAWHQIARKAN
jgi:mRNA interferase HigB